MSWPPASARFISRPVGHSSSGRMVGRRGRASCSSAEPAGFSRRPDDQMRVPILRRRHPSILRGPSCSMLRRRRMGAPGATAPAARCSTVSGRVSAPAAVTVKTAPAPTGYCRAAQRWTSPPKRWKAAWRLILRNMADLGPADAMSRFRVDWAPPNRRYASPRRAGAARSATRPLLFDEPSGGGAGAPRSLGSREGGRRCRLAWERMTASLYRRPPAFWASPFARWHAGPTTDPDDRAPNGERRFRHADLMSIVVRCPDE